MPPSLRSSAAARTSRTTAVDLGRLTPSATARVRDPDDVDGVRRLVARVPGRQREPVGVEPPGRELDEVRARTGSARRAR